MRRTKAFTLVELVVVVMILGILAAVAAPKLLGTSKDAAENALRQTLAIVRDGIERYAADNGGQLPGQGTEAEFKIELADYIRGSFPVCPVGAKNADVNVDIATDPLAPDSSKTEMWFYNRATGEFIVNSVQQSAADPTIFLWQF